MPDFIHLPSLHVLVVDDDIYYRNIVPAMLYQQGVRHINTAADGQAALQCLDTHQQFGLIITDLNMPGMDGLELISQIKARPVRQHIPILMVAAPVADQMKRVQSALRLCQVPLLQKSTLSGDTLRREIRRLISF